VTCRPPSSSSVPVTSSPSMDAIFASLAIRGRRPGGIEDVHPQQRPFRGVLVAPCHVEAGCASTGIVNVLIAGCMPQDHRPVGSSVTGTHPTVTRGAPMRQLTSAGISIGTRLAPGWRPVAAIINT
jgi:hypothetical protein